MYIVRVNGQDITNTPVGQEFARDFHIYGGRADVQANGDLVINISNDRYVQALDRQLTRGMTATARMGARFVSDARTALREAHGAHAPAPRQTAVEPASAGPLTSDDLNELGQISDGAYDNFAWLNGVL